MAQQCELSVVIPAYNESSRLPATLQLVADFLLTLPFSSEIIVADDGSQDETRAITERLAPQLGVPVRVEGLPENRGKGAAVRAGVLVASGKYILVTDADNATPITELPRLWAKRKQASVVVSSRYLPNSDVRRAQPLLRRLLSRAGNLLIRLVTGLRLTDTQNGFKLFEAKAAQAIFSRAMIDRWGFDIELLVIAREQGWLIAEVPVTWYDASGSKLRAGRDAWRTLKELNRIVVNRLNGRYRQSRP
jgi:glycosyltransferase involved in cell wall biosynthesis